MSELVREKERVELKRGRDDEIGRQMKDWMVCFLFRPFAQFKGGMG